MEFRFANKLDPNKKYTIEEIKNMSNYTNDAPGWPGGYKNLELLNRYDDDTLLYLINEIAQNNSKDSLISFAKNGKKLNYLTLIKTLMR